MKLILVTGAGGGVAEMTRPLLRERYRLRLSDRQPLADVTADEEFVKAELDEPEAVARAVKGVDGVLHLGGFSLETNWDVIRRSNIEGAYNVFEAAYRAGVKRIIFASSNHVMGFYPRTETVSIDRAVLPDSRYALSKAFGEALGALYAEKYGMEVLVIRIGHIVQKPVSTRDLAIWLSPRDFVQLVGIGFDRPGLKHELIYGMSDNARAWWDNSAALGLGYRPQDKAEDYAADVLARGDGMTGDPKVDDHQGGGFCTAEAMVMPDRSKGEIVD